MDTATNSVACEDSPHQSAAPSIPTIFCDFWIVFKNWWLLNLINRHILED